MRARLDDMFAAAGDEAVACLGDGGLTAPLTLSLSVGAEGGILSHSCTSGQDVSDEQCRCILESVLGEDGLWSTPGGFEVTHTFAGADH
jgi:hypothetical protein